MNGGRSRAGTSLRRRAHVDTMGLAALDRRRLAEVLVPQSQ